jgi:polysaccharide export outer membrane protein
VAVVPVLSFLTGCIVTPASGPFTADVVVGATEAVPATAALPYALVTIDPRVVDVLARFEPKGLAGAFTDRRAPTPIKFGVGDVVSVTVFEAAAGGLFIPIEAGVRPGNFVTLPEQSVDNDGNITVPYAGTVRAAGRTNVEIQADIVAAIRNRAIEPQVVVALSRQNTSLVSVFGEVGAPVRYPAATAGAMDRVTDAITRAGGIKGQGFETWVMLERGGRRATVPFANLVYEPSNNIFVQPGDRIYVYREQQKFFAFGASGAQGEFNFDAWRINLAQAVAKAGGLVDAQADPGAVFLYRLEPRDVALALGVDVAKFNTELIPIIFSTSFRQPRGYFLATKLQMRNADIIFVANAAQVEINKFLDLLNNIMGTTSNAVALREQLKTTVRR